MDWVLVISLLILLGAFLYPFYLFHKKREQGIFIDFDITHISGIPGLEKDQVTKIIYYEDKISFDNKQFIPIDRAVGVRKYTKKELVEQEKSFVGRAAVGTILLGGLGAILGGMSSLKGGKNFEDVEVMVLDYLDKDGEQKQAVFLCKSKDDKLFTNGLMLKLNNQIGFNPNEKQSIEI